MNAAANCTGSQWTAAMENVFVKDIKQTDLPSTVTNVELLLLTIPIKETGQICAMICAFFWDRFRQSQAESVRVKKNRFRCSVILFNKIFQHFSHQIECFQCSYLHVVLGTQRATDQRKAKSSVLEEKISGENISKSNKTSSLHFGRTFPGCYVLTRWLLVDHRQ